MSPSAENPSAERRFDRGSEEFGRVLAFSDGMFAIAMTLLVVGIAVPTIADADSVSDLAEALDDLSDQIISFFISFAVIGRYWVAHHQMFSLLKAFDPALIRLNLLYLALIAFLPFPTALLGDYFSNPLALSVYAVTVAATSGLEVVLLRHAHRRGLLTRRMPEDVFRWGLYGSLVPVVTFLGSIPVAFALGAQAAVLIWLLGIPAGLALARRSPDAVDEFFA